jgi:adenylate cyclase
MLSMPIRSAVTAGNNIVICIGPAAAARCDASSLRLLSSMTVHGSGAPITAFELWPDDASPARRDAYVAAYSTLDRDPAHAAVLLERLLVGRPADPVPHLIVERLFTPA